MTLAIPTNIVNQPDFFFKPDIDISKAFRSTVMTTDEGEDCETGITFVEAGADGPPIHLHPNQDETFKVLQGKLEVYCQDKWYQLSAGEEIFVPKNTPHTFRSRDTADCYYAYHLTPKGGFTEMLRTFEQMMHANKIRSNSDIRSLIYLAMIFKKHDAEVVSVNPPPFVMTALAGVGKLFGFKLEA